MEHIKNCLNEVQQHVAHREDLDKVSVFSWTEQLDKESVEDLDRESAKDLDKESAEDLDKESAEDLDKQNAQQHEKKSAKQLDKGSAKQHKKETSKKKEQGTGIHACSVVSYKPKETNLQRYAFICLSIVLFA